MLLEFLFDYRFHFWRKEFLPLEKKLWVLSIMIFYHLVHLLQVLFLFALFLNRKFVLCVAACCGGIVGIRNMISFEISCCGDS